MVVFCVEETFDEFVKQAMEQLPEEFRNRLENVEIFVEDMPSLDQLRKLRMRRGHTLLGLYEGVPQTKRGNYGIVPTLPDKITLFRIPIMHAVNNETELVRQIRDTLFHEIGHHFGMSEEELREAQKKL